MLECKDQGLLETPFSLNRMVFLDEINKANVSEKCFLLVLTAHKFEGIYTLIQGEHMKRAVHVIDKIILNEKTVPVSSRYKYYYRVFIMLERGGISRTSFPLFVHLIEEAGFICMQKNPFLIPTKFIYYLICSYTLHLHRSN
jgi:hypothetical protein